MKRIIPVIITLIFGLTAAQINGEETGRRLTVFVSIPPQKYFVQQIGGEHVDIRVMLPPGAHPATYEPAPRQMTALADSDIYFAVGVPFEKAWMDRIRSVNPELTVVHTDAWIQKQPIDRTVSGTHVHNGRDPHIWLSPPLVMIQARHILAGLTAADPGHARSYNARYRDFACRLAELDTQLRSHFPAGEKTLEFLVFHPSWGYFADAYGLNQIAVETGGRTPKPAEIRHLIEYARQREIRAVLVQPQISTRTAEVIARAIDGRIVTADPLAENWRQNLLQVADQIHQAAR